MFNRLFRDIPKLPILFLFLLVVSPSFLSAQEENPSPANIHVNGYGVVFGTPDIARIEIGYEIAHEDLNQAFEQTSETLFAIRDALLAQGLANEDIQTRGLSLWVDERYTEPNEDPQRLYRLSNAFGLTIRDIERVPAVIDAGIQAGANSIHGLSYAIADTSALQAEARRQAVNDARTRAADLAALFNLNLGEPIVISEFSNTNYGSVSSFKGAIATSDSMGMGGGGPIEAGQLSVEVQLAVSFGFSHSPQEE